MGGSNLPPGVSDHMIPGNRPEDLAEEEFWEKLAEKVAEQHPKSWDLLEKLFDSDHEVDEAIVNYARVARDLGYIRGFNEGKAEEQIAQVMREEPEE